MQEEEVKGFPSNPELEDESGESGDDDDENVESLIRKQNRKKKKSGGFQSMGEKILSLNSLPLLEHC